MCRAFLTMFTVNNYFLYHKILIFFSCRSMRSVVFLFLIQDLSPARLPGLYCSYSALLIKKSFFIIEIIIIIIL